MKSIFKQPGRRLGVLALGLALLLPWAGLQAAHDIRGITGGTNAPFNLYAFPFNMNLPDGSSVHMWGFGDKNAGSTATHSEGRGYRRPQYPAPTLIVTEGQTVSIELTNYGVPQPVSIVVTGHQMSTVVGGSPGLVTNTSANKTETVTYTFEASEPGTYIYHSLNGANPGLHAEMGLQGVLIVRPKTYDATTNRIAYNEAGTDYDQEFLYLLTEVDPDLHFEVERGHFNHVTHSNRKATIWFVNGRVFPDLFQGDFNPLFRNQPYQALALAHPSDKVLVREVNAGHDSHPFHHHGENMFFIARDGRALSSGELNSDSKPTADLGRSDNTLNSAPKQTVDMIWTWTGKNLNWDIYGTTTGRMGGSQYAHTCGDPACTDTTPADGFKDGAPGEACWDAVTREYCPDHGKEFPVDLPGTADLALGGWWSGSPFLGDTGSLPPGEGGLNPFGGYFFVWHSHAEKELTTFDIFPGGSLSSMVILPPALPIN